MSYAVSVIVKVQIFILLLHSYHYNLSIDLIHLYFMSENIKQLDQ